MQAAFQKILADQEAKAAADLAVRQQVAAQATVDEYTQKRNAWLSQCTPGTTVRVQKTPTEVDTWTCP
jgi:hypothetical protein